MISEKDLRIGNWVKHLDHYLQVTSINPYMICCDPHWGFDNFDDIEGIPLSPEILEKAGFKKQPADVFEGFKLGWYYISDAEDGLWQLDRCEDKLMQDWEYMAGVEYLHQLQNLFYLLTGTELLINLH